MNFVSNMMDFSLNANDGFCIKHTLKNGFHLYTLQISIEMAAFSAFSAIFLLKNRPFQQNFNRISQWTIPYEDSDDTYIEWIPALKNEMIVCDRGWRSRAMRRVGQVNFTENDEISSRK